MSKADSPFMKRFEEKARAGMEAWKASRLTRDDFRMLKRAFVEALREEVEARFTGIPALNVPMNLNRKPVVIAGLGSFKMRTRPAAQFDSFKYAPQQSVMGDEGPRPTITKPPARRLVFTSKWEPIDP